MANRIVKFSPVGIQFLDTLLQRAELKGTEVPAFVEVVNALRAGTPEVAPVLKRSHRAKPLIVSAAPPREG